MISKTLSPKEISGLVKFTIESNTFLNTIKKSSNALEIVGEAGIGKTTLLSDIASELGMDFVKLNLGNMEEVSDLIGYPAIEYRASSGEWINEKIADAHTLSLNVTRMGYAKPSWVPTGERPTLFVLDDFNRTNAALIQATMELINTKEYVSWSLPSNTHIFLTSNPPDGDYNALSLDIAQSTRMFSVTMDFDVKDWVVWATKESLDTRCIDFIIAHPELITRDVNARIVTKFFNSITFLKDWELSLDMITNVGLASVGTEFTLTFIEFINKKLDKLKTPHELLTDSIASVKSHFTKVVGKPNSQYYRQDIAYIYSRRLTPYLEHMHKKKLVTKPMINQVIELLTNELFSEELILFLTKEIVAIDVVKFRAVSNNRTLMQKMRNV